VLIKSNTKALSPVIASIVLIAVTMAVAIVIASWMGGMTIGLMGNAEQTKITNVAFLSNPINSVNVTILNAGPSSITLQNATIDGKTANITTTGPTNSLTITKNTYANVLITNSGSFASGIQYTIKITTAKGNTLLFTSVATTKAVDPTSMPDPTPAPTPPPQVTFVSAGAGSGTTGTPKPKYPTGIQSGDLILLQVTIQDTTTAPTTPDGFTALYSADSTNTGRQWIYYKFTTGAEPKSLTISISGSVTKMARMYAFSNVSPSSFAEDTSFGSGTGSTINAQSVSTDSDSRLAVSFVFVGDNNAVGSFVGETGGDWIEAVSEFKTSSGSDGCIQLQIAAMATAGQLAGGSYTMSASDPWGVRAFSLVPL
jgi:FlaG/FlaF family flagellin (archaellin)